ncbi:MAG: MBL fold metallo-hydrolase [Anaerolineales bacterium]
MTASVEAYPGPHGARIYRLPMEVFPGLMAFAHLVCAEGFIALVDCGSGFGESNAMLEAGMRAIRGEHGERVGWPDLTHILITHGHIDHFGGLPFVREKTGAQVGIHELDVRVLTDYEERLTGVDRRLAEFLGESGLTEEDQLELLQLYRLNKKLFASVPVDFTFVAAGMRVGPMLVHHVPGHCPGHVALQLGDILLAGDHVLMGVSPHLAPERLSLHTGLGHYLESLSKTRDLAPSIRLSLGGHGPAIHDLAGRIDAIEQLHVSRLGRILDFASSPRTLSDISKELFPHASGYHGLLAVEEAGAHVEFLAQRGYLRTEWRGPRGSPGPRYSRKDRTTLRLPELEEWTRLSRVRSGVNG